MTRVLSELLGAKEPNFRTMLRQLEQAAGSPCEDIRLTGEINLLAKDKIRELNLDPKDTTNVELYYALNERVRRDNATLLNLLGKDADGTNLMPRIERLVGGLDIPKKVFAMKGACAKRLLKANPPKRAMKQLGYRSIDSMLKHETPAALFAAARLIESTAWHKTMLIKYKKLLPGDFESRDALLIAPGHERWEKFAQPYVERQQHNILTFRELGAVVLLPLTGKLVEGAPLAATLLTLQALVDMRSTSTYLKLHQVRSDFGTIVAQVSLREPAAGAHLVQVPLPWKLVHHFFARTPEAYQAELFEPHVQPSDLAWEPVGHTLSRLHPTFEFWRHTGHLGVAHHASPVSLNPLDAVINFCNHLPYEQRIVRHLRSHLWHELLFRYMRQGRLEQTVQRQLSDELMGQPALV